MNCDERRDQIVQLVAGDMDPVAHEELRAHLETGCTRCAEALSEARMLELALSLSPDPLTPSPSAKMQLRERLTSTATEAERAPRTVWRRRRVAVAAAVAAGIAIVGFVELRQGALVEERNALLLELDRTRADRERLREELDDVRAELAIADEEASDLEESLRRLEGEAGVVAKQIAMLRSPEVVAMALAGTDRQPGATARVFWGKDYYCYLNAHGLQPLESGRTYAMWLDTQASGIVLAGTFFPDSQGEATLWVPLDSDLGTISRAFVTDELADDVGQEPTGAELLVSTSQEPARS